MRLFIAIDFDDKSYFKEMQDQIPTDTAKLNLTGSYHLTLKFLGEVEDNKADMIKERLGKIKVEPFSVSTGNVGFFPSESHINVIWVGFKDNNKIIHLQEQVENSLMDLFKKEDRFHPHITLARVKFVKDKEKFLDILKNIKIREKTFEIKNIKLIKSTLKPEGPVYEDLGVFS